MGKKIVVALGGNALGSTCAEQKELVKNTFNKLSLFFIFIDKS